MVSSQICIEIKMIFNIVYMLNLLSGLGVVDPSVDVVVVADAVVVVACEHRLSPETQSSQDWSSVAQFLKRIHWDPVW